MQGRHTINSESPNHKLLVYIHNICICGFYKIKLKKNSLRETESYACQMHGSLRLEYLKIYMNKYYKLPLALFIGDLEAIRLLVQFQQHTHELTKKRSSRMTTPKVHTLINFILNILLFYMYCLHLYMCSSRCMLCPPT